MGRKARCNDGLVDVIHPQDGPEHAGGGCWQVRRGIREGRPRGDALAPALASRGYRRKVIVSLAAAETLPAPSRYWTRITLLPVPAVNLQAFLVA